jgi:hypothetical protein
MTDITPIVLCVVAILGALWTYILAPYIKSKTTAEQRAAMQTMIGTLVYAAEQIYKGTGRGQEKLEYVVKALEAKGIYVNLDDTTDAARAMIEAAVLAINK